MAKTKVGDYFLVSDNHQTIMDKAEVVSITEPIFKLSNGFFKLSNGLKVNLFTLEPINSSMQIMIFDEEVWEGYKSRFEVKSLMIQLQANFKLLSEMKAFTYYKNKLNKLNTRLLDELDKQQEEELRSLIKKAEKIRSETKKKLKNK